MHRSARNVGLHSPEVHSALHAAQAFENILAFAVRRVCPKKPLWIEHEGRHVGKVRCTNLNLCLLRLSKLKFPTFCALQASVPFGVLSWVTDAPQGLAWEQIETTATTGVNVFHHIPPFCILSAHSALRSSSDAIHGQRLAGAKISRWLLQCWRERGREQGEAEDLYLVISLFWYIWYYYLDHFDFPWICRFRETSQFWLLRYYRSVKAIGWSAGEGCTSLIRWGPMAWGWIFLLSNIGDCIGFGISDDTGCSNDVGLLWQAVWEVGSRELLFETDWCGMWLDRSHLFRDLAKVLHDFQMS